MVRESTASMIPQMNSVLHRYTVNTGEVLQLKLSPQAEGLIQTIHQGMKRMDADGFDAAGFRVAKFAATAGRAVYYVMHEGRYLCFTSVCLHEIGSAEAWEAAERQFLEATEQFSLKLDIGWQPDTPLPPAPWFAVVLFPEFLADCSSSEVFQRFGAVEPCIVWALLRAVDELKSSSTEIEGEE